jgi:hypothetical protein
MRLLLRLLGTWLLGMALILVIIDGTRSLAANALVMTPLADTWTMLQAQSLIDLRAFLASRFFGALLETVVEFILSMPGWLVLGVPGAVLAWMGRTRRSRVFVNQDQF